MSGVTGAKAYLGYGKETSFKTAPADTTNVFGKEQRLTNVASKNVLKRLYDIGQRTATDIEYLNYEGSWSLEAVLSEHALFELVLGDVSGNTYSVGDLETFTMDYGLDMSTDIQRELYGCAVNTCKLSTRINEEVRLALDGVFAIDSLSSTLGSAPSSTKSAYTFEGANIELPKGTAESQVQTLEISFMNNPEFIWGIGSRFPVDKFGKEYACEGRYTAVLQDKEVLQYLYHGDTTKDEPKESGFSSFDMECNLSNHTTDLVLDLANAGITEVSHAIAPNELIYVDVAFICRTPSISFS